MENDIIKRLSQYKKILQKLKSLGLVRVFSDNLSDALGISSSLVRKDFAACNITGKRRGGYVVEDLIERLNTLLGKDEEQQIIIVGCGKLGSALMNHKGFASEQIRVSAGFDVDLSRIDTDARIPVYPLEQMEAYIKQNAIQVAVLTVPEEATQQMIGTLKDLGIRGILNFAAVPVKSTPGCNIQNVNLALELEKLFYMIIAAKEPSQTGDLLA
ncbi:MAG: redox-sensing transcriptional repressor Rex [Kiritimatiellia bacterium]